VADQTNGGGFSVPLPRRRPLADPEAIARDLETLARDPETPEPPVPDPHAPRHLADSWEGPVSQNRPLPSRRHGFHWLLLIPTVMPLLVPLYNRESPRLFGLPFFYWYQLASVVVMIVVVTAVYQLTKGRRFG
jgi:Protein of unknown function (DUF3311)